MILSRTVPTVALMSLLAVWWLWPGEERGPSMEPASQEPEFVKDDSSPQRSDSGNPFAPQQPRFSVPSSDSGMRHAEMAGKTSGSGRALNSAHSKPLTSDDLQSYLKVNLSNEAQSHPIFDFYLSDSLEYVQAFPDWLTAQEPLPLSAQELELLGKQLESVGINQYNLTQTQRLQTALQFEQARASEDVADFQWRVEQYDDLLNELVSRAADPQLVSEQLAEQIFTEEERDRALHYHQGLYQREADEKAATDD